MARILTGVQSTGTPHLGNILGAIKPAVELANKEENDALLFIADLHSLTSIKDGAIIKENTKHVAASWLAFGFDTDQNILYRQSDVPEVTELAWYLLCHTPIPMLENAHSFKDKSSKLKKSEINTGLFTYPVLMAADILLYDAEHVPVGKDQQQHLEMTRDIAGSFNHQHGETFVLPEPVINEQLMTIPGIDGRKMSKSYDNGINIFLPKKKLQKNINLIVTDSLPLEAPKNPDTCHVFQIYKLLANEQQTLEMKAKYEAGNYGYGHAKKELCELIMSNFEKERAQYNHYIENEDELESELSKGAEKARVIAQEVLERVRNKVGF